GSDWQGRCQTHGQQHHCCQHYANSLSFHVNLLIRITFEARGPHIYNQMSTVDFHCLFHSHHLPIRQARLHPVGSLLIV
ncbi:MAG: hypothetical protein PVI95_02255, partial [Dehalococcoidia bacterium]